MERSAGDGGVCRTCVGAIALDLREFLDTMTEVMVGISGMVSAAWQVSLLVDSPSSGVGIGIGGVDSPSSGVGLGSDVGDVEEAGVGGFWMSSSCVSLSTGIGSDTTDVVGNGPGAGRAGGAGSITGTTL